MTVTQIRTEMVQIQETKFSRRRYVASEDIGIYLRVASVGYNVMHTGWKK